MNKQASLSGRSTISFRPHFLFVVVEVSALFDDVRPCPELKSSVISRKTNDAT